MTEEMNQEPELNATQSPPADPPAAPPVDEDAAAEANLQAIAAKFEKESRKSSYVPPPEAAEDDETLPPEEAATKAADSDDAAATEGDEGSTDAERDAADRQSLADAYGVPVEQLQGFSSVKDAERALALWDAQQQHAFLAGQEQGQQQATAAPQQQQQPPAEEQSLAIELSLDEWDPEEPTHKNFTAIKKSLDASEQRVQRLEAVLGGMLYERRTQEISERGNHFNNTLDEWDTERYGKLATATPVQRANREKLSQAINQRVSGILANGGQMPTIAQMKEQLIEREDRALFFDQIEKERAKKQQQQKPNGRPRLGAPGRGQSRDAAAKEQEWKGEFEDNPNLHKLYHELEEAGTS